MFLRAVLAFLALPGVVAIAIPAWITWRALQRDEAFHAVALLPMLAGFALLLWCVRDFYVAGKGTLAPWESPRHLVTVGLYRLSRNPMYVAVALILVGWSVLTLSRTLAIYTCFVIAAFHLRVLLHEEPFLARTHGAKWDEYRTRVPRWLL
jgi:protein-S-isoprenylcysteine O-methyltransferase Ste14